MNPNASLGNLLELLRAEDPRKVCPLGFAGAHSYRGYYEDLSFEPAENVTVAQMLAHAESALGHTFEGYKGGDYKMGDYSTVWLAKYGETGETLGPTLVRLMLERGRVPGGPPAPLPAGDPRAPIVERIASRLEDRAAVALDPAPEDAGAAPGGTD